MKQIIITFLILFAYSQINAQGIDFFHGTWAEALEEAKQQDKIIFVDAYAEWCGPCKRMARNVFTDAKVGAFYNENFINMKLDMEKGEGLKFRKKYPVSAFPTLFFIDYTGELIAKIKGAQQAEPFIQLGKSALKKVDRSSDYAAEYEKGKREPELVYNYVKALNQAGKPSLKIANEYLDSQKDLDTKDNLMFILEAASEADSRIFDLLIEKKKALTAITSAKIVNEQIEKACRATAIKAIEFESEELLEEAKAKMKKHYPERAKAFAYSMDMDFCKKMGDANKYTKICSNYAKKIAKDDAKQLYELATELEQSFAHDKNAMIEAEKLMAKAAKNGTSYSYYYHYARVLSKNGKKTDALDAAKKSLEIAKAEDNKRAIKTVERLIDKIES